MGSAQSAIASYLELGGYGTLATSIFVDFMPSTPETVVVVTGYSGPPPQRVVGLKAPGYNRDKVQVKVRGRDPGTTLSTIESIYSYLEGVSDVTSDGLHIVFVTAVNSHAIYLGKDDNGLTNYSLNFEVKA